MTTNFFGAVAEHELSGSFRQIASRASACLREAHDSFRAFHETWIGSVFDPAWKWHFCRTWWAGDFGNIPQKLNRSYRLCRGGQRKNLSGAELMR